MGRGNREAGFAASVEEGASLGLTAWPGITFYLGGGGEGWGGGRKAGDLGQRQADFGWYHVLRGSLRGTIRYFQEFSMVSVLLLRHPRQSSHAVAELVT